MFMHSFWILIILAGLFFLVRWLVRSPGVRRVPGFQDDTGPLEILKQRYARGEIDRGEFERMRRDLEAI
jgi:putative membrane protein